jgi:RimJ/RimL family protein N-acetyltransferase
VTPPEWPQAEPIDTTRLTLEPLRVGHAEEMAPALDDPGLHEFIGGSPATADELRTRYAFQVVGHSPDDDEGWLNWVIRRRDTGDVAGTVQATLRRTGPDLSADVAWVVASAHQGQGLASEASTAMVAWLRSEGVGQVVALIHPDHGASAQVARHLGLVPTDDLVDGEVRWVSVPRAEPRADTRTRRRERLRAAE